MLRSRWISLRVSRCGENGDMMPDRRAHTRAAGGARRDTGSATDAGTAGPSQRDARAGAIDRAQNPRLGGSVRQTLAGEPRSPRGRTTSASRSRAASFWTRRCSVRISWRSSESVRSVPVRPTTWFGEAQSHARAVDRGTPRFVAMRSWPVRRTSSRSRWS